MDTSDGGAVPLPNPPADFSIESDLAGELLKLSFNDRVAIQEEIHGVRCLAVEETSDLIERSLLEFDAKLLEKKLELETKSDEIHMNVLRNVQSITKLQTQQQNQESFGYTNHAEIPISVGEACYLNDPQVRLRFLRSECFDVDKAIKRLVGYLDLSSELFGDYVADRAIRISDFNSRKEEVALHNSRYQYLPFRDRSGRRVFVGVGHCDFDMDARLRYKIMLFLHWVASEDVETQQKGVVIIAWPTDEGGRDEKTNKKFSWENDIRQKLDMRSRVYQQKLEKGMPLRVTSQQAYFPDTPFFRAVSVIYYMGMDSQSRSMYKAHYGELIELRYILSGYGIPEQLLPLSHTGTVKTASHSRWINALRAKDHREKGNLNKRDEEEIVNCPGAKDVIFRKGPTYKNNPGNMYFRELLEATHDQHATASRKQKCMITWQVVDDIEANNGRFLDWSSSLEMWVVAKDREKIRKKVAACYKQYKRSVHVTNPTREAQLQITSMQRKPTILQHATAQKNSEVTNTKKVERELQEYYDVIPSTKRQKTGFPFCGTEMECSSSSDSSDLGCGLFR